MKFLTSNYILILLFLFVMVSCDDDESPSRNDNIIDSAGGVVKTDNDEVIIDIPAGALSMETEITIAETSIHPPDNIGQVYDLGPDGTTFAIPVSLTFTYDEGDLPAGALESELVLAFADNGNWVSLAGNVVDETNNTVTATTTHFTPFTVFWLSESNIVGPSSLAYSPDTYDFILGQTVTTEAPTLQGTPPFVFSIENFDPQEAVENFSIDPQTGIVTATGTSIFSTGLDLVTLEIAASNDEGSVSEALTFNLLYPPSFLNYSLEGNSFFPGDSFDSGVPGIDGTTPFEFALDPLPAGLTGSELDINTQTGQITGTFSENSTPGMYSLGVTVTNVAGTLMEPEALTIEIMEQTTTPLPENISYDVSSEFFVYTGGSVQIDITEGSSEDFTYSLESIPETLGELSIDNSGNLLIGDQFLLANGPGYFTMNITLNNGEESRTYENAVIIRAFSPSGYILEYNPRFSQVSAFNPEILSASTNALFEPPDGPIFTIERVYDQFGDDRTLELTQQGVLTIAADGDLTFNDPQLLVISDNFYYFYVDVRVNGPSGNLVYKAVAVFGPE
jgi:hypothetical protein